MIDVRRVAQDIEDVHFVSVVRPVQTTDDEVAAFVDDVEALSYDTTCFTLDALGQTLLRDGEIDVSLYDEVRLRDRFVNLLSGAVDSPGPKSAMRFANMENSADLRVYKIEDHEPVLLPKEHVGWGSKLAVKWQLLRNRFGLWPLGSILVILATVVVTSIHDIYRWYGGSLRRLLFAGRFLSLHFLALVGLQALVATALFVFLGETGRIRYDSWINGFVIALAPSPILRANLVRIGGKNVGFAEAYDRVLQALTRQLLVSRYPSREERDNRRLILAYYNSLKHLRNTLLGVYRSLPNREEADRLRSQLESTLEAEPLHIEKRKICAQLLMELRPWDELDRLGCVPPTSVKTNENIEQTIHEAVRYCHTKGLIADVEAVVEDQLERATDKARTHYANKKSEAEDDRDKLYAAFQFLVLRLGFTRQDFAERGWVEPDGDDLVQPPGPGGAPVKRTAVESPRVTTPGNGR